VKIGLAVEASCDLPERLLNEQAMLVLPSRLRFAETQVLDDRDPRRTMAVYRRQVADRSLEREEQAMDPEVLCQLLLDGLVTASDRGLVLARGSTLGQGFAAATQASYAVLGRYRQTRVDAGLPPAFGLRVVDTRNVGPGEGAVAYFAHRALASRPPFDEFRRAVEDAARRACCLLVPQDPVYLRGGRSAASPFALGRFGSLAQRLRGGVPILSCRDGRIAPFAAEGSFEAGVQRVFAEAGRALAAENPPAALVMSFGGDPRRIRETGDYQNLEAAAARRRLGLQFSVMSASLALHLGPGAFAIAWVSPE
jgi:fatty acid-binding protein DegV